MKRAILIGVLITAGWAGYSAKSVQAQSGNEGAECDRLIVALQGRPPGSAHDALQKMQVYRREGQYWACVDAGRMAQNSASPQAQIQVAQALGMDVFNDKGEQVGDVDRLARGPDGKVYVLMTYRGPRWPGNKQVAVPIERMTMQDGRLLLPGVGEKEILAMPAVPQDGGAYTVMADADTVPLPGSQGSPDQTGSLK